MVAGVRNRPLRTFTLSTEIPAPAGRAAALLLDVRAWPRWNRLVPRVRGDVAPGALVTFAIRQPGGGHYAHRARVLELEPLRVVLSAVFLHPLLLRMDHAFDFVPVDPGRSRLDQSWSVSGVLAPLLWRRLVRAMARFAELGDDLAGACR